MKTVGKNFKKLNFIPIKMELKGAKISVLLILQVLNKAEQSG